MSAHPQQPGRTYLPVVGFEKEVAKVDPADHYKERVSHAADWFKDVWNRAAENSQFVRGGEHQWDSADHRRRASRHQPTLSMNDTALAVNAVSGREVTQRYQTAFRGRNLGEQGDARWAETVREVDRWVLEKATAAEIESDAFRDLLIHGFKAVEWRVDYMDDWRGRLVLESYAPWECIWDPMSTKPNRTDREWDAIGRWVSLDAALAMFPEAAEKLEKSKANNAVWIQGQNEATGGRWPWVYQAQNRYFDKERRCIFLVSYQYRERAPAYLIHPIIESSDGSVSIDVNELESITRKQFKDEYEPAFREAGLAEQFGGGMPYVGPEHNFYQWSYYEAFFAGTELLDVREIPYGGFTRCIMTGIPVKLEDRVEVQSLVDLMRDGQRFKNAILSYAVSHFSRGRKGGAIYTADTFGEHAEAALENIASVPEPWIPAKPETDLKSSILQLNHNEFPNQAAQLIEIADEATWKSTGLNPATLGQMGDLRRVSGKVFSGIAEAGQVVLSQFFQALRQYRQEAGAIRLAMYKEHYDAQFFGKIVGPKKAEYIPPAEMWEELMEFDVIVDESEATASEQVQMFDLLTRTGTLENLLASGQLPMEIFVNMLPTNAITESDREMWLERIQGTEVQRIMAMLQDASEEDPELIMEVAQQVMQLARQVSGGEGAAPPQQGGNEQ